MYTPNLFSNDLYKLWNDPANTQDSNNKIDKDIKNKLYAPPLSAYSTDFPGASLYHLQYTINSTSKNSQIFENTPLTQSKRAQLAKIRNTGYTTIRPIGIIQTLEEIELEKNYYNSEEHSINSQGGEGDAATAIENSNDPVTGVNGSTVSIQQQIQSQSDQQSEIDLDAQILNADDMYSASDDDDDVDDINENFLNEPEEDSLRVRVGATMDDEGFMAATEIEYQDDHSLNSETHNVMLMGSGTSGASTNTQFNSSANTGHTVITNATTTTDSSLLRIDEQNENDYSEQDMVVD
ncbi:conserved hypothetical protein [Candida tropicalis MYA-3404]|uniref:Uncharacterized protein n=1 Tax=Candida tropicalis (strain ATCC MYA-3404 / T1) TaxID=294747 RepID=C5M3V4_CANTT|nr:conserved hypothetical protein [Candida tropicalis MYA-3404]EER36004.1 conserved hypothetical protein [Candida tropicalis MYA-3404]KAG4410122.1 hypothetical protein JTP64_000760 [Candida tropicalis]